ncbi:MAG TPA: triphosphoribosyl-dephospho-CoA synthase, partial [Methyloceanibacter sp.]|nr:triphosphoribosyl-dephospho-CoA synthase [Methyloceanibacter sp.]
ALKARGLNPGTSADLTVATLFAAALIRREGPD